MLTMGLVAETIVTRVCIIVRLQVKWVDRANPIMTNQGKGITVDLE